MTMHEEDATWTYRCDVCATTRRGDYPEAPPPGMVTMLVRPEYGPGLVAHACIDTCLGIAADNIAEGRLPDGTVAVQPKELP